MLQAGRHNAHDLPPPDHHDWSPPLALALHWLLTGPSRRGHHFLSFDFFMRTIRPIQAALALAFCSAFAMAAPSFLNLQEDGPERVLKDGDMKTLAKRFGEWFEVLDENKDTLETKYAVGEEIKKLNKKKLKGGNILKHTADLGFAIYSANNYGRKDPRGAAGKVVMRKVERGDLVVEYAIWTPPKYRGSKGPYPVIISIPEEGENPKDHITNRWTHGGLKDRKSVV